MTCWTEWDPLEEVIVGDCFLYDQLNWNLPRSTADKFRLILEESKQDLDNLSDYLAKMGVKVHRPKPKLNEQDIQIAGFNINLATAPMVPRDQYMIYGETVYQTYTSLTDRYIDSLSYYEIFKELFDQGHNWISQPPPELINFPRDINDWFNNGEDYYKKKYTNKLLWHTACMFKYGDTLITNHSPGTAAGLEWMRRNTPQGRILVQDNFGHIDHGFFSVNDDIIVCEAKEWVPDILKNKKLLQVGILLGERKDPAEITGGYLTTEIKISDSWLDKWLNEWRGYAQKVCFDFNPLVVDPTNVIFTNHQPKLFKLLDSLGINSHVCPIRHGAFWESGIHCLTLDLKRKGEKRRIVEL
jgi:glycine amidinotransferase